MTFASCWRSAAPEAFFTPRRPSEARVRRCNVASVHSNATTGGVALTAEGRRLFSVAEDLESRIATAARDISSSPTELSGSIRVTAGDGFGSSLVRLASEFRRAHPKVSIHLVLDHRIHDLSRREADLALRSVRPRAPALIARRLGEIGYGLYASREYVTRTPTREIADLTRHTFVGYDGPLAQVPEMRWLAQHGAERFALRTTSMATAFEGALHGEGIAALPHLVALASGLCRVLPGSELPSLPMWLVCHRDVRRIERIRRFSHAIVEAFVRGTRA
jgi:DNA-binding transcriptional LysR family regulator